MKYFLAIIPVILVITYSESNLDPVLFPRMTVLSALTLVMMLIVGFGMRQKGKPKPELKVNRWILIASSGLFLTTAALVSKSVNTADGIFEACKMAMWPAMFLAFSFLLQNVKESLKFLSIGVVLGGAIVQLIGIGEYLEWFADPKGTRMQFALITSVMGNKNIYASFITLSLPFAGFLIIKEKKLWRTIGAIYVLITLFNVLSLQTRAAWVALGVMAGGGIILLLLSYGAGSLKSHFNALGRMKWGLAIGVIGVFGLWALMLNSKPDLGKIIQQRTTYVVQNPDSKAVQLGSVGNRLQMWDYSLQMFKEDPIIGKGPGSWTFLLPTYGGIGKKTEQATTYFKRPHNDYLWIMSEMGSVGFIFYLLVLILPLLIGLSLLRSDTANKSTVLFMMTGIAAYMTFAFFSFPKERVMHQVLLWMMISCISVQWALNSDRSFVLKGKGLTSISLIFMIIVVGVLSVSAIRLNKEQELGKMLEFKRKGQFDRMSKSFQKVYHPLFTVDNSTKPIHAHRADALFQIRDFEKAQTNYEKAREYHPNHLQVISNLGSCAEVLGDHDKAVFFFNEALELSPNFQDAICNLSAGHFNQGDFTLAYETINRLELDNQVKIQCENHLGIILRKQLELLKEKSDSSRFPEIDALISNPQAMIQVYREARIAGEDILDRFN